MNFLLEVRLPSGDTKQYEFDERITVDKVLQFLFKQPGLTDLNQKDYGLVVDGNELCVHFIKFLSSTGGFSDRAKQGLPILVSLEKRANIQHKGDSRPGSPAPSSPSPSPSSPSVQRPALSKSSTLPGLASPPTTRKKGIFRGQSKDTTDLENDLRSASSPEIRRKRSGTASGPPSPDIELRQRDTPPRSPGIGKVGSGRFKALFKSSSNSSTGKVEDYTRAGQSFEPLPLEVLEHTWADPSEWSLIECDQFGFHNEVGNNALDPSSFGKEYLVLEVPQQEHLYEKYFLNKEHTNYVGFTEGIGPCVVSIVEDKEIGCTRALVRSPANTQHICIDHSTGLFSAGVSLKTILGKSSNPVVPRKGLKRLKSPELVSQMKSFDASHLVHNYKFGILYCKEGQTTEDEWFGNEHGSAEFDEFLNIIGERITLQGFDNFRGGLDVNGNSTGKESIYTEFRESQIMFHVSTLLPYHDHDEQKIERKRHLGNDIVVIIYKEGNTKFPPAVCKSVFNHTYIVVQRYPENDDFYQISVATKDGVKAFGPPFPFPPIINKSMIREFLLTKMLNAEWAAYRSLEFSHKFKRTRKQQLTHILKQFDITE